MVHLLSWMVGGLLLASCSSSTSQIADMTPATSLADSQVTVCTASDLKVVWRMARGNTNHGPLSVIPKTTLGRLAVSTASSRSSFGDHRGQDHSHANEAWCRPATSGMTNDVRTILLRPASPTKLKFRSSFLPGACSTIRTVRGCSGGRIISTPCRGPNPLDS